MNRKITEKILQRAAEDILQFSAALAAFDFSRVYSVPELWQLLCIAAFYTGLFYQTFRIFLVTGILIESFIRAFFGFIHSFAYGFTSFFDGAG